MMIKKIALILLAASLMAVPVMAGNIPEFDVVGDDTDNLLNDFVKKLVIAKNPINLDSDFTDIFAAHESVAAEFFKSTAASPRPDPCFYDLLGYQSRKAGPWFENTYEYRIVLQMAPETDLNLNIRDCILKENQTNIWFYAQQAARYRKSNGRLVFNKAASPRIAVTAIAGYRNIVPAGVFFYMDARKMPGLGLVTLDDPGKKYTSKALWEEGLVLAMPEPGAFNQIGQPVFPLREGDLIYVKIKIPFNNPVDYWYGPDNVSIKYVGIIGLDLVRSDLP
jgi:hypothetical protein